MKRWLLAGAISRRCAYERLSVVLVLLAAGWFELPGQSYHTAETTYGIKLGTTKPLYDYYAMPATDPGKLKEAKRHKPKIIPNFQGRGKFEHINPHALPAGADPLWRETHERMTMHSILPIVNVEGISQNQTGSAPPDVNGDAGLDHYVEIVNATSFRVYNKMGQSVSLILNANSIWSQLGETSAGDPILLYDQTVDRWLLTEFAPVNRRRVLLAISENGDPRGAWTGYEFQTPQFPDFPKYGIWHNAYFLTANENGFNFPIYAFNRADMLAGEDTVRMQRLTIPKINGVFFEVGQPIDWDGLTPPPAGSPGLVVKLNDDAWGTTTQDVIQLSKINIDWDTPSNSNIEVVNIPCSPYDTDGCNLESTGGFSCIPQPNNQGIDGAQWIITNKAMYRNFGTHESFVMCFMVDVTGNDVAGIRWIEFRKTAEEDWHIYQEGTVGSDDGIHRFMPSIGIDGYGTIGLAYGVSGYSKQPSLRYTGRFSYDEPGVMTFQEHEFATGTGSQGFDRYGDYFSMSVDPADEATFWFSGQYLVAGGNWNSKIVAFRAVRDSIDIAPVAIVSPVNATDLSSAEPLTVAVRNQGLSTVRDFELAFQFNGGEWVRDTADIDSLLPDSIYYHTFDSTLQFAALGQYTLRVATVLNLDQKLANDTLDAVVSLYPHRDLALEYVTPIPEVTICGDQAQAEVILRNVGGDTVTTALLELRIDGEAPVIYPWTGSLAQGEETQFIFLVNGLKEGINTITLTVVGINNDLDQIPSNNEIQWAYDARIDGEFLTLEFKTDNFPAENTWELFDEAGVLIASGGPYPQLQTVYQTNFCIQPEACYTFTIYDSAGDGIDSGVDGYFTITDIEGDTLAAISDPDFDEELAHAFCVSDSCMLIAEIAVSHVTRPGALDGVAFASGVNGVGELSYAIDGSAFVSDPVFTGLDTGAYVVIVQDQAGCTDTITFRIEQCQLQMQITALPANPGDIGEIHVAVTGANGAVQYSLNGGGFQVDSFWTMLEPGTYFITARDSLGCEVSDTILISTVSTQVATGNYFIRISPNPGTISFHIAASFPNQPLFVPYSIFSADGEFIQRGSVVRYNETHRDQFYMVTAAPGTYFVIFELSGRKVVHRVIKL